MNDRIALLLLKINERYKMKVILVLAPTVSYRESMVFLISN